MITPMTWINSNQRFDSLEALRVALRQANEVYYLCQPHADSHRLARVRERFALRHIPEREESGHV